MKRAYFVRVEGWEGSTGVAAAETPEQAKHRGCVSASGAGYEIPYTRFRVRRAPEFDAWAEVDESRALWSIEAVARASEREHVDPTTRHASKSKSPAALSTPAEKGESNE